MDYNPKAYWLVVNEQAFNVSPVWMLITFAWSKSMLKNLMMFGLTWHFMGLIVFQEACATLFSQSIFLFHPGLSHLLKFYICKWQTILWWHTIKQLTFGKPVKEVHKTSAFIYNTTNTKRCACLICVHYYRNVMR